MDITQAKEALRRTFLAYQERGADGCFVIPPVHQRPVLLLGPPGIGKTAILRQLAGELDVGLVSYTMTHHTRQSALGLPRIAEETYDGVPCAVTRYTMSEILAAVYDQMAATGRRTGILFLDEINCVSETLVPAMLELLQEKRFGVHRLPEGWVIAAAGNPPQYNPSARPFDTVTLDRVKLLEVEPDLAGWQRYAAARGVHPAILSYLTLNPGHFYRVEPNVHGRGFVTARGWEDLSRCLLSYERLGFPVEDALFSAYLRQRDIAAAFAVYYRLFAAYRQQADLPAILDGRQRGPVPALRDLRFDGRLAVVELLLHALRERLCAFAQETAFCRSFGSFTGALTGADPLEDARARLARRQDAAVVRKRCGVLTPEEEAAEARFAAGLRRELDTVEAAGRTGPSALAALRGRAEALRTADETAARALHAALERAMDFVYETFGAEQELLILLTQLGAVPECASLLRRCGGAHYEALLDLVQPERLASRLSSGKNGEKSGAV